MACTSILEGIVPLISKREFEFAHSLYILILDGGARSKTRPPRRVTNQCGMRGKKGSKIFGKVF